MKVAVLLIAVVASVHSASVPRVGWSTPPPTQGWSQPSTAGWGPAGILSTIDLNAGVAAVGSGWAGENHAEDVSATGGGGWGGPPAQIVISASGNSVVAQDGAILQVTNQDEETAASINDAGVSQIAEASEAELVDALGLEISNAQSGWAGATGEGASAATATSLLNVQQLAENLGLARP